MEEGKENGGGLENVDQAFSSSESESYVALIVVMDLLQRINPLDRVPSSRMSGRILTSIKSGDLISRLLDLGRASFDFELVNLFPDGVYEGGGEEAHWLGASVNCFSPWSSELFLRTPRRECDTITCLCVL